MSYYLTIIIILFLYMNSWFLASLIKKRNDIVDIAWGIGFVLLSWLSLVIGESFAFLNILLVFMVSIWGIRLAYHIYTRNKAKSEDYRYLAWRRDWGKYFYIRSYFQVYILQGTLLFLVSLPILLVNNNSYSSLGIMTYLGVALWLIGFLFEAIGDYQLKKFMQDSNNKGRLLQSGLWSYTRHPNYFGEVLLWWGIWFIAFSVTASWLTLIGPLTITFLILKVSGVSMLEKKMSEHKDFSDYKRRTSAFFPLPPKK